MRSDINILWIEDSPKWQKAAEKLFLLKIAEYGLLTNIRYISEGISSLYEKIENEVVGYKVYDIIFVDYNISGNDSNKTTSITGDKLIEEFRKYNIDADILFYSENLTEGAKKKIILTSPVAFDGIYLASRKDFQENALKLYRKNIRKLTSMLNIRGLLTDKTSENDYVMNSFLLKEFDNLQDTDRKQIFQIVKELIQEQLTIVETKSSDAKEMIKNETYKIKKLLDLPDFLFPILSRYKLFSEILKIQGNDVFNHFTLDDYQEKIIKTRNTVAHKKIDICKQQKYLKYYDTIKQFNNRRCPDNCEEHINDYKISLNNWHEILKLSNEYSKLFDKILYELENNHEN